MENEKEIMRKLQAPFRPEEIEWRVGRTTEDKTRGLALAYVTNRAIQNRLDEVFGPFGWSNEFKEWKNTSQICGISIFDEQRKTWVTKWDGADDSQMEAVKGGLSDSMKRTACQWGIGRYLYELEPVWMPVKQVGKSYMLVETPQLPAWALPEGYAQQQPEQQEQKSEQCQQQPEKPFVLKKTYRKQEQELASQSEQTTHPQHHESGTDPRIKTVRDLTAQKGVSERQVVDWMKKYYHKESVCELDKREYASLLHSLKKWEKVV